MMTWVWLAGGDGHHRRPDPGHHERAAGDAAAHQGRQAAATGGHHRHALAGAQVVQGLAGQLAVAFETAHGVVHVAVVGLVGQALLLELADDVQHLAHVLGGARLAVGRFDAQRAFVGVHGVDVELGDLADAAAGLDRAADDLVIDVGDIAHVVDRQAAGAQPALHHVEGHQHAGVSQVAEVVHGHATHVHAHLAGLGRFERFFGTR